MDKSPNFYLLREQLRSVQGHLREANFAEAKRELDEEITWALYTEAYDRMKGPYVEEIDPQLETLHDLIERKSERAALTIVHEMLKSIEPMLPRFTLVLRNETRNWNDEMQAAAGQVWGCYLYDENRVTHLAELTPSYELGYLYETAEKELPDHLQEDLMLEGAPDGGWEYVHCGQIDNIGLERKVFCGRPVDPTAETYEQLVEKEMEYYRSNVSIDLPRAPGAELLVHAALNNMRHDPSARDQVVHVERAIVRDAATGGRLRHRLAVLKTLMDAPGDEARAQAMDLMRQITGVEPAGERMPAYWAPLSRRAVVADLQGGVARASGVKPLIHLLTEEDQRALNMTDEGFTYEHMRQSTGAYSVACEDTEFFQHVSELNPGLAAAWKHGVEDVHRAFDALRGILVRTAGAREHLCRDPVYPMLVGRLSDLVHMFAQQLDVLTNRKQPGDDLPRLNGPAAGVYDRLLAGLTDTLQVMSTQNPQAMRAMDEVRNLLGEFRPSPMVDQSQEHEPTTSFPGP